MINWVFDNIGFSPSNQRFYNIIKVINPQVTDNIFLYKIEVYKFHFVPLTIDNLDFIDLISKGIKVMESFKYESSSFNLEQIKEECEKIEDDIINDKLILERRV